jgi:hypothetical protein
MRFLRIIFFFLIILFLSNPSVHAEIIVSCKTTLDGQAYYHKGDYVKRSDSGWKKDKISNYEVELTYTNNNPDISFKDSTGRRQSASSTGGVVYIGGASTEYIHVVVLYPEATTELYTFDFINNQLWNSIHKYGSTPVRKSANFVGKCRF